MSTATENLPAKPREPHWMETWARDALPAVLPRHMKPDEVVRIVFAEFVRNPKLKGCTPNSLKLAVLTASQMGLQLASPLGEAYLIPRWSKKAGADECNLQIGYKGLLRLLRNSGEIQTVIAEPVYAGESFDVSIDTTKPSPVEIRHDVRLTGIRRTPDDVIASYCIVVTKDGGRYAAWCTRDEIEDRRQRGASGTTYKNGDRVKTPWDTDYAAMARKCAILKLTRGGTVPLSSEVQRLVEHEASEDERWRETLAAPLETPRLADYLPADVIEGAETADPVLVTPGEE